MQSALNSPIHVRGCTYVPGESEVYSSFASENSSHVRGMQHHPHINMKVPELNSLELLGEWVHDKEKCIYKFNVHYFFPDSGGKSN